MPDLLVGTASSWLLNTVMLKFVFICAGSLSLLDAALAGRFDAAALRQQRQHSSVGWLDASTGLLRSGVVFWS